MSSFSFPITVDVHDVDYNGACRPSSLLRYIQSSAQMQLNEHGMSYNELYENRHRAFLLSKITVEFYDEVREGDRLVAETFPVPSRGYSFLRCYQLWRDERIIGRAISAWALIDTEERRLIRTPLLVRHFPLSAVSFQALLPAFSPMRRRALPLFAGIRIFLVKNIAIIVSYDYIKHRTQSKFYQWKGSGK